MIRLQKPRGAGDWFWIYRLYRTCFPASERKPFGIILKMYRRGKSDVWLLCREGNPLGMAVTINGQDAVLLDYFAVKKHARGQGVGTSGLRQLLDGYGNRGFFLEIESTRENGLDRELREKRKAFYEFCGLRALDVEAEVFGVRMELLGKNCQMDFEGYRRFYREEYSPWAAEHILQVSEK